MKKKLTLQADLTEVDVDITIKGKTTSYKLTNMTGTNRERYFDELDSHVEQVKDTDGKQVGRVKKHEGMRSSMLMLCMVDAEGKPVSKEFLDSLPAHTLEVLYDTAGELNALSEESKQEAKKE